MISQTKVIERELKKKWLSNREINDIICSAHGDRRCRSIRENTPAGYKFARKKCKFKPSNLARTVYFEKYKLIKCVN